MPVPRIDAAERRRRVGVRHRLAPAARAATPEEATDAVVVLHATDPATVVLSVGQRLAEPGVEPVLHALHEDRSILRMHGMRRTLFGVPRALIPVVQRSSTDAVAAVERRNLLRYAADAGKGPRWVARLQRDALAAIAARGEATAAQVAADVPRMREQLVVGAGTRNEARQGAGSRLLVLLGMEGRLERRRPVGTWASGTHYWAPTPPVALTPPVAEPSGPTDVAGARAALVLRWLEAFGPGTEADVVWWTGWGKLAVRAALAACGAVPVTLDEGADAFVAPGDEGPTPDPGPWAALLPGLDPTTMGWRDRDWYLDPAHVPQLFDRNGNAGPTVWWAGRIVGGWATAPDGEVRVRLLEDVGADARSAIDAEAVRLGAWLGGARIVPRYPVPLWRELGRA